MGIKGRQSGAAPLASDFCKSDHLQLPISHFWPFNDFNVAKCCQRNSRDNGLNIRKNKHGVKRTGQTSQPSLQNEAPKEVCFCQIGPAGTTQLLPCSGWNLRATTMQDSTKVQLLQGRVPQDFQQVCRPIGTFGAPVEAPGMLKRGVWGEKDRNLLPLLLQVTSASPTICNCLFHNFGLPMISMLPNCCQRNSRPNGLNIRKRQTRLLTNWQNIATKFAKRGTLRSLLLSNWSSWHRAASATQRTEFESNHQSTTSPGESSARLPAGLPPHRHLCHR